MRIQTLFLKRTIIFWSRKEHNDYPPPHHTQKKTKQSAFLVGDKEGKNLHSIVYGNSENSGAKGGVGNSQVG